MGKTQGSRFDQYGLVDRASSEFGLFAAVPTKQEPRPHSPLLAESGILACWRRYTSFDVSHRRVTARDPALEMGAVEQLGS